MLSLAGIEAEILFCEARTKKIAANRPCTNVHQCSRPTLLKNNFKKIEFTERFVGHEPWL
jgi:hypothetical protein